MTHMELDAFLAVCHNKNITKAAQELFITQSALSMRLKHLEKEIGCALLIRSKGKHEIELTAKGWEIYKLALQYQDILSKIKAVGTAGTDTELRVSAIASVGNYLLQPVYARFMDQFPDICLYLDTLNAVDAVPLLTAGTLDIAFSGKLVETDRVTSAPLLTDSLVMLCSRESDYPETVTQSMLRLKDEVLVEWSPSATYWHQAVFGTDVLPFAKLQFLNQVGPTIARPGKWGFVPQSMADHLCKTLPVRQCKTTFPLPNRTIYLLRSRDMLEAPKIQLFIDILREELNERSILHLL